MWHPLSPPQALTVCPRVMTPPLWLPWATPAVAWWALRTRWPPHPAVTVRAVWLSG